MAQKDDHNHEEEELDPLDREDLEEEDKKPEDEGEEIELRDQKEELEEEEQEEVKEREEDGESEKRGEEVEQEEPESEPDQDADEKEIKESSDEKPLDLDESEGDGDKGLPKEEPRTFKTSWQDEEPQDIYSRDIPEKDDKQSLRSDDLKEHTLDDLAREGTGLPTGVEPSKPKSFADDFKADVPHVSSHMNNTHLYANRRAKGNRKLNTFLLFVIALLVIGGSVYLLKAKFLTPKSDVSYNTPVVASSTPEPTPIPTPELDRSQFTVRVLNGTTKSGLAASVSSKLKNLGYQTDKTANATNSAFQRTVVRVKDNDASLSAQLVKDLSPDFDATSSTPLKSSDTVDAEVILGQQ